MSKLQIIYELKLFLVYKLYIIKSTSKKNTLIQCISMNESDEVFSINYKKSLQYWADIPPTVDGVLGGFGFISNADIEGSELFLKSLLTSENPPSTNTALDCGAGIGRITKQLLLPHFDLVDVVEPDEKFINSIKDHVGELSSKLGSLHKVGLQEFIPVRKYDVVWNQWVLGYLKDEDLEAYLIRCRDSLSASGIIVVKENVTSSGKIEKDSTDSSVTRTFKQYIRIFKKCNLKRIKQCKQANFPNGIYPVYMFALVPNQKELERSITKANGALKNSCIIVQNKMEL